MARATMRDLTSAQLFGLVIGAIYVVLAIVGFAVTGFDHFASESHDKLLVFEVNPLHNLVHAGSGLVWLAASRNATAASGASLVLGVVYGLVTVLGATGILEVLSIESLADPDNFLHLATSALALYFGSTALETRTASVS